MNDSGHGGIRDWNAAKCYIWVRVPIASRLGPIPHHRWGRTCSYDLGVEEQSPPPRLRQAAPVDPDWSTQLLPDPQLGFGMAHTSIYPI